MGADLTTVPGAPIQNSAINVTHRHIADMTQIAADVARSRADADVQVAKATHATPARQESVRLGIVVLGAFAILGGHLLKIPDGLLGAALATIGGAYGIPKAIEKWRAPQREGKKD